jgi:hypothetical protein
MVFFEVMLCTSLPVRAPPTAGGLTGHFTAVATDAATTVFGRSIARPGKPIASG